MSSVGPVGRSLTRLSGVDNLDHLSEVVFASLSP